MSMLKKYNWKSVSILDALVFILLPPFCQIRGHTCYRSLRAIFYSNWAPDGNGCQPFLLQSPLREYCSKWRAVRLLLSVSPFPLRHPVSRSCRKRKEENKHRGGNDTFVFGTRGSAPLARLLSAWKGDKSGCSAREQIEHEIGTIQIGSQGQILSHFSQDLSVK